MKNKFSTFFSSRFFMNFSIATITVLMIGTVLIGFFSLFFLPTYAFMKESCTDKEITFSLGEERCGLTFDSQKNEMFLFETKDETVLVKKDESVKYHQNASLTVLGGSQDSITLLINNYDNTKDVLSFSAIGSGSVMAVVIGAVVFYFIFVLGMFPRFK